MADYSLRRITPADGPAIKDLWDRQWGGDLMVVHAEVFHAAELPGFIAEHDGSLLGLVTCHCAGDGCEVISLDSLLPGQGIGSALLDAVVALARQEGRRRVFLSTTNDNTRALRFYQKYGFRLVALRPDAVSQARKIKPSIPDKGDDGIPIRDELELELVLPHQNA